MISTDQAEEFLNYFCYQGAGSDHAVLIDAPWGAGKTYFLKNYLRSRDSEARKLDELVGAPYLYASFYGASTLDEIREQFFAQAFPVLTSRPVKLLGSALAGVIEKFTGAKINQNELAKIKPKLEAKILVFDDLERAAMPLVDALGFINSFVEHGDHRVIVVANQKEIPEDQKVAYERQREKVIGRTLAIRASPSVVLTKLVKEMRNDAARSAVESNSDIVISIFDASGTQNLRSLRAAISDFDRLIEALDGRLAACPDALRRILIYLLCIEIEFRSGLSDRELRTLMSLHFGLGLLRSSESPEMKRAGIIREKYPEVEWRDAVLPSSILADYLVTGVIDVDAANEALLKHPLIAPPQNVPPWLRLLQWQMRGAQAFADDRAAVLTQLTNYELLEPGEICHVAGVALWLENMGAPILADVEADIERYVDYVEAAGTLRSDRSLFRAVGMNDGWAGYIFASAESDRFLKTKAYIGAAVDRIFDAEVRAAVPDLLTRLAQPGCDGKLLYDGSVEQGHYGGVAILHHVNVSIFADLLVSDGRVNRELSAALRRYQYWGRDGDLLAERSWLKALESELNVRADVMGAPYQKMLKGVWERTFNEIFSMIKVFSEHHSDQGVEGDTPAESDLTN